MIPEEYLSGLEKVKETRYPTYCSPGARQKALQLSKVAEKAQAFLDEFIKADSEAPLLVLNEEDWKLRFKKIHYGMMTGTRGIIHFPADEETPGNTLVRVKVRITTANINPISTDSAG